MLEARRLSRILIPLALAATLVGGASARAVTATIDRDRSDNTYYFDYDAASGKLGKQSSNAFYRRGDRVSFFVYIREAKNPMPGERLLGLLQLNLNCKSTRTGRCMWNKTEPVTYAGTFSLKVYLESSETVVYEDSQYKRFTLRHGKEDRKAAMRFMFDLPSGSYLAKASFEEGDPEPTPSPSPTPTSLI
jgi:hypothetical protein